MAVERTGTFPAARLSGNFRQGTSGSGRARREHYASREVSRGLPSSRVRQMRVLLRIRDRQLVQGSKSLLRLLPLSGGMHSEEQRRNGAAVRGVRSPVATKRGLHAPLSG